MIFIYKLISLNQFLFLFVYIFVHHNLNGLVYICLFDFDSQVETPFIILEINKWELFFSFRDLQEAYSIASNFSFKIIQLFTPLFFLSLLIVLESFNYWVFPFFLCTQKSLLFNVNEQIAKMHIFKKKKLAWHIMK